MESLTKTQTFRPDWLEPGLIRAEYGPNDKKTQFQEPWVVLHCFFVQLQMLTLFLVLTEKFDQKSNFLSLFFLELGLIRAEKGLKRGESMIFKSREWYYIVSMYNYYWLTLFLVLIKEFDQKSNFQPRLA